MRSDEKKTELEKNLRERKKKKKRELKKRTERKRRKLKGGKNRKTMSREEKIGTAIKVIKKV